MAPEPNLGWPGSRDPSEKPLLPPAGAGVVPAFGRTVLNNAQDAQHQQDDQEGDNPAAAITDAAVVITAATEQKDQHNDNNE